MDFGLILMLYTRNSTSQEMIAVPHENANSRRRRKYNEIRVQDDQDIRDTIRISQPNVFYFLIGMLFLLNYLKMKKEKAEQFILEHLESKNSKQISIELKYPTKSFDLYYDLLKDNEDYSNQIEITLSIENEEYF